MNEQNPSSRRRVSRRRFIQGTTMAGFAAFLAACAGIKPAAGPSGAASAAASASTPIDMTLAVWTGDKKIIATYESLADSFRQKNPRLGKFTVQTIGSFDEYFAQLLIQLDSGHAPDIGWVVESATPALVASGAVADISSLRGDPAYNFDDIIPGLYSALNGKNGAIYGYPFASTTHPIIFNKTAFAKAKVDSPLDLFKRGEWNWVNLRRISKEIVASGAVRYGFDIPQFGFKNYALFTPFMNGFGAEAWPGGTTCGYATPESKAAFEFVRSMIREGTFPGPGNISNFPTGDVAMFLGPPSLLSTFTNISFEFDIVPQPAGQDGKLHAFLGQASLVVFKQGKDPKLATELLGAITSKEGSAMLQNYYVPPRKSLLQGDLVAKINALLTPEAAKRTLIDPLYNAKQLDYPVAYPRLENAVRPILDEAWQPSGDVSKALTAACAAAMPILLKQ